MVIYDQLLKEYFDNCFFEERDWLFELDGRTIPLNLRPRTEIGKSKHENRE